MARDDLTKLSVIRIDVCRAICDGDGFISRCEEEACVDGEGVIGVERDFGATIVCKAWCVHADGVVTDGKNGQRIVSLRVGVGGVEEVGCNFANINRGVRDETIGGIFHGAGDAAATVAEGERCDGLKERTGQ
jgi:hypothetical protein